MWIRIRDPHGGKINPSPDYEHFLKIYWFFKAEDRQIIFLLFSLKLDKPFRDQKILIISIVFNSSELGVESKKVFFVFVDIFCFVTWIRIRGSAYLCGSGSRKPNSCESNNLDPKRAALNWERQLHNYFKL